MTKGKLLPDTRRYPLNDIPGFLHFLCSFSTKVLSQSNPPADLAKWSWTFQVSSSRDPTLTIAARGAQRTMIVVAAAVLAFGTGLWFIVRGTRAAAELADDAF